MHPTAGGCFALIWADLCLIRAIRNVAHVQVYEREHYAALALSVSQLSAPHTLSYLAFKSRGAVPVMSSRAVQ